MNGHLRSVCPPADVIVPLHVESPYAAAKRDWNACHGRSIAQVRTWRVITIVSLVITMLLAVYAIRLAGQLNAVPYVVKVDGAGPAVVVSRADQTTTPDPSIVRAQLANWIRNARSVSSDPVSESAALARAYAMIGTTAKPFIDSYYSSNSPFSVGSSGTIAVTRSHVRSISPTTYHLQWTEEKRDRDGAHPVLTAWEAQVTIGFQPPSDAATIVRNPLGIYVTQLSWTQRV